MTDLSWAQAELGWPEFQRIATYVEQTTGIRLSSHKRVMVESRLRRCLRAHGMTSFRDYCAIALDSADSDARRELVEALTTHKTAFFREPHHFDWLADKMLPELWAERAGSSTPLRVWSAACSNGAEPYSLAMACADAWPGKYSVLGTDLSYSILRDAVRATYSEDDVAAVEAGRRRRYLLRSRDRSRSLVKIAPEIRRCVRFRLLNLVAPAWNVEASFDVIFCRNVLIYFRESTQRQVVARLCRQLRSRGFLVLGHAEAIAWRDLPLEARAPTLYQLQPKPGPVCGPR